MRISFTNFARAAQGDISINDLTIICGPNGSGKTYASYAVYGCLYYFTEFMDFRLPEGTIRGLTEGKSTEIDLSEIIADFDETLRAAGRTFASGLDHYFNAPDGFFSDATFSFLLDKNELQIPPSFTQTATISKAGVLEAELLENTPKLRLLYTGDAGERLPRQVVKRLLSDIISSCLFGNRIPRPFVVTSERTGVALFYKELDINRNAILSHISSGEQIDPIKVLQAMQSRYARPIQHNIDTVRDYGNISKQKSFLREDKQAYADVLHMLNELVGGSFRDNDNQLMYSPRKERNKPKVILPLYIASSSIKSLFLIDMYINHISQPNGILIIDEPELNLHPDNQVRAARLVARLVNAGIKVLVTTHSDYFIREINNLISLGEYDGDRSEILDRYRYSASDLLRAERVSAYCSVPGKGIVEMDKSKSGIDSKIFDAIINEENYKAQEIYDMASE